MKIVTKIIISIAMVIVGLFKIAVNTAFPTVVVLFILDAVKLIDIW
jgi:uncharacterized membrane protein YiaA